MSNQNSPTSKRSAIIASPPNAHAGPAKTPLKPASKTQNSQTNSSKAAQPAPTATTTGTSNPNTVLGTEVFVTAELLSEGLLSGRLPDLCADASARERVCFLLVQMDVAKLRNLCLRLSEVAKAGEIESLRLAVLLLKGVCAKALDESIERTTRLLTLEYNKRVCDNAQRAVGATPDSKATKLRNKMIQQIDKAESIRISATSAATSNSRVTGDEMQSAKNESEISGSISKSSNIHRSCCPRPHPAPHITDSTVTSTSKKSSKKTLRLASKFNESPNNLQNSTKDNFRAEDSLFFRSASSGAENIEACVMQSSKGTISYLSRESNIGPTDTQFVSVKNRLGNLSRESSRSRSNSAQRHKDMQNVSGLAELEEQDPMTLSRQDKCGDIGIQRTQERGEQHVPKLATAEQIEEILTDEEREQSQLVETESMIKGDWVEPMDVGLAAEDDIEEIDSFLKHEKDVCNPLVNPSSCNKIEDMIRASMVLSTKAVHEIFKISINQGSILPANQPKLPRRQSKEYVHILRYSLPKHLEEPLMILQQPSIKINKSSRKLRSNIEYSDKTSSREPFPISMMISESKQHIVIQQSSVSWLDSVEETPLDKQQNPEELENLALQASSLLLELSGSHYPLQNWILEKPEGFSSTPQADKKIFHGQSTEETKHTVSSATDTPNQPQDTLSSTPLQRIHTFLDTAEVQPLPIPVQSLELERQISLEFFKWSSEKANNHNSDVTLLKADLDQPTVYSLQFRTDPIMIESTIEYFIWRKPKLRAPLNPQRDILVQKFKKTEVVAQDSPSIQIFIPKSSSPVKNLANKESFANLTDLEATLDLRHLAANHKSLKPTIQRPPLPQKNPIFQRSQDKAVTVAPIRVRSPKIRDKPISLAAASSNYLEAGPANQTVNNRSKHANPIEEARRIKANVLFTLVLQANTADGNATLDSPTYPDKLRLVRNSPQHTERLLQLVHKLGSSLDPAVVLSAAVEVADPGVLFTCLGHIKGRVHLITPDLFKAVLLLLAGSKKSNDHSLAGFLEAGLKWSDKKRAK